MWVGECSLRYQLIERERESSKPAREFLHLPHILDIIYTCMRSHLKWD